MCVPLSLSHLSVSGPSELNRSQGTTLAHRCLCFAYVHFLSCRRAVHTFTIFTGQLWSLVVWTLRVSSDLITATWDQLRVCWADWCVEEDTRRMLRRVVTHFPPVIQSYGERHSTQGPPAAQFFNHSQESMGKIQKTTFQKDRNRLVFMLSWEKIIW